MADDVRAAYPAVPEDRLHVIYNGIDAEFYHHDENTNIVEDLGVDLSRPYVTFVGRITPTKGVPHLLRAGLAVDPSVRLVLLAGAADAGAQGRDGRGDRAVALDTGRGHRRQRDVAARERSAGAVTRAGVPLPVGLRATRHRQPRGHGLRDGGRGECRRWDP